MTTAQPCHSSIADQGKLGLLVFSAHPDDAEICCGGWLHRAHVQGYRTGILDLTAGQRGTQGTLEERLRESEKSSTELNLSYRHNLKLPDCGLSENSQRQLDLLVEVIRQTQPQVGLVPHWEERHPDHLACEKLASKALFLAGLRNYQPELGGAWTTKQIYYYPMRFEITPSIVVDVTESWENEVASILAHSSQVLRVAGAEGKDGPLVSSELFMKTVESRARFYGAMIGVEFGEAYLSRTAVAMPDPVKHAAEHPGSRAVIYLSQ